MSLQCIYSLSHKHTHTHTNGIKDVEELTVNSWLKEARSGTEPDVIQAAAGTFSYVSCHSKRLCFLLLFGIQGPSAGLLCSTTNSVTKEQFSFDFWICLLLVSTCPSLWLDTFCFSAITVIHCCLWLNTCLPVYFVCIVPDGSN